MGYATTFSNSDLYLVDFDASTATLIGSTGRDNISGIAIQPGTGVLFGIDHATDTLVTIDPATGAATTVGNLGASAFDVGLEFDAAGNLYMSSDTGGTGPDFYSVDTTTGAATLIGSTGTGGIVGLALDSNNVMYGLADTSNDALYTIDLSTGVAALIGSLGLSTNTGGIGFDDQGVLHGVFGIVNPGLTVIDVLTGMASTPVNLGLDFASLAMISDVSDVPVPGALLFFATGLAGLGAARKKRRAS
ncbi:MAG: hypothetical protein DHS20C04_28180 [Hyphococcus sp.]|nr:MAG: hypothetical protein DHS20C04_28180 [Marinicaulis sp.]